MSDEKKTDAMQVANDGGAAFPRPYSSNGGSSVPGQQGMSLLDWFAGQALVAIIARAGAISEAHSPGIAWDAYEQAKAMVAEHDSRLHTPVLPPEEASS